jgi:LysM repeat protein
LGRHRKPSRIRLPQGATAAAAPTLATVAAAFCLSPAVTAATPAAAAVTHGAILDAAVLPAGYAQAAQAAQPPAVDARARATASAHKSATALPATYKVRSGDTLSSIAHHLYGKSADWTVLYWRNHRRIKWADDIFAGQVLHVPAKPSRIPAGPSKLHAALAPASAPPQSAATPAAATTDGGYPGGAFGACVVAAESGGNPQVMNASGHYGLYQFSEATWVAYGGNPADFGHATVAEQNQVFANALAAGGEDNWAPYDGC